MSGTAPGSASGACDRTRACQGEFGHRGKCFPRICERQGCDSPTRNTEERRCIRHEDRATYERYYYEVRYCRNEACEGGFISWEVSNNAGMIDVHGTECPDCSDMGVPSCDWGGCDLSGVSWRLSSSHGWLPVCEHHAALVDDKVPTDD